MDFARGRHVLFLVVPGELSDISKWSIAINDIFKKDRSNISNARVAGLQKDLKMTNKQYSIALTVTYVPYIVAELPSNLLLKVC